MCLLAFLSNVVPGYPLLVAANRDEVLARPAESMTVFQDAGPRVWAGRDLEAGGTWMACNEHGVVAGLTNQPGARLPNGRSRGELPLRFVGGGPRVSTEPPTSVASAIAEWQVIDPAEYSGCWMFVGGRDGCTLLDLTTARQEREKLESGVHVLENRPFAPESPKASGTRRAIEALNFEQPLPELAARLREVFSSVEAAPDDDSPRPPELRSRTVHFGFYGTRTFSVFAVPDEGEPVIYFTDGPPDSSALQPFGPS